MPAPGRLGENAAPGLAEQPAGAAEDLLQGSADVTKVTCAASRRHHLRPACLSRFSRYDHDISTA
jgi:hypothetical protein